jgi:hypothetical protein
MGPSILMDVHISVDPTLSVSSAHQIAERARIKVLQTYSEIGEFLVHVEIADEYDLKQAQSEQNIISDVHSSSIEHINGNDTIHDSAARSHELNGVDGNHLHSRATSLAELMRPQVTMIQPKIKIY